VLHQPLHLNQHMVFSIFDAGHFAGENGALAALGNRGAFVFSVVITPSPAFSSCARTSVFTRARSFFCFTEPLQRSACPVESGSATGKSSPSDLSAARAIQSTPDSRIFSIRRGIVKILLRGKRTSWESAACAPASPMGFLGRRFVHSRHLEHDASRFNHRHHTSPARLCPCPSAAEICDPDFPDKPVHQKLPKRAWARAKGAPEKWVAVV